MNKLLLIIILLVLLVNYRKVDYFDNKYLIKNISIPDFYSNPYTISLSSYLYNNIFSKIENDIPFNYKIIEYDEWRYNDLKKKNSDLTIVKNRLLRKNDNYKFVTNLINTYIYLIVKSDSNINSFQDCKNKKIVIGVKADITNDLARRIFKLLGIDHTITYYNIPKDDKKTHIDFYKNNKYDAIFQEDYIYNNIHLIKNKNIKIITGNTIINNINEQDNIIEYLKYDENVNSIHKIKLSLSKININKYDYFISLPKLIIANKNVKKEYIYKLLEILNSNNIISYNNINDSNVQYSTNTEFIDDDTHEGTIMFFKKNNLIPS